jgi:hypothetical protein
VRSRATALVLVVALMGSLTGCFGYNKSSKGWAYVGDSILVLGGAAAIAEGATTSNKDMPCDDGCSVYTAPFSGMLLAGIVVATAGLFGFVLNATRTNVKGSSH